MFSQNVYYVTSSIRVISCMLKKQSITTSYTPH